MQTKLAHTFCVQYRQGMRTGTERIQNGCENGNGTGTELISNGYRTYIECIQNRNRADTEQIQNGNGNACRTETERVLSSVNPVRFLLIGTVKDVEHFQNRKIALNATKV